MVLFLALMRLTNFARENKSKEAKDIVKHYDHLMGVCPEGANYYVALFLDQLEREISTQTNVSLTVHFLVCLSFLLF